MAVLAISATILLAVPAVAADWTVDASHSSIGFEVRHMAISKVKGSFGEFEAKVTGEPGQPGTFTLDATVQVASVDTGNEKRDDHLRSPDFFDAAAMPTMTFKSTGVTMDGDEGTLSGDLTLHGVTKPVVFALEYAGMVNDPWGNVRMGFSAEAKIDRREFGLTWSKALETGGLVVDNEVEIELEIELVQAK